MSGTKTIRTEANFQLPYNITIHKPTAYVISRMIIINASEDAFDNIWVL